MSYIDKRRDPYWSVLNNLFCRPLALRRSDHGNTAIEQGGKNEEAKKPQLPEDHPKVVAGAAQHSVHRVAQRTF